MAAISGPWSCPTRAENIPHGIAGGSQPPVQEMQDSGETPGSSVLHNVIERDRALTREVSPLRKAADAIELDNSHMGIKEQFEWALEQVKRLSR